MGEFNDTNTESKPGLDERFKELYEPAVASRQIVDYMAENPFCSREEFRAATNTLGLKDKFPETLYLAGAVLDARTRVRTTYEELSVQASKNTKTIAETLFIAAQGNGAEKPKGKLEMGYLNYPFALVVLANDGDFVKLHSPDSGGYYYSSLSLFTGSGERHIPFIAVRNGTEQTNKLYLPHEKGHAKNDLVAQGFAGAGIRELWGEGRGVSVTGAVNLSQSLMKAWKDNSQNPDRKGVILSNPAWRRMRGSCLDFSKDEIIVRLTTGEPMDAVTQRLGGYDLLSKTYNMGPGSELGDYIWEKYTAFIQSEIQAAQKAMAAYKNIGLTERADILPWMLMRVPLGEWKGRLNEIGITSEVEVIEDIIKKQKDGKTGKGISPAGLQNLRKNQDGLLVPDLIELSGR